MKLTSLLLRGSALLLTFATTALHAHSVWIEDTSEKKLLVRFGEFGGEYESSPGYLDSLTLPSGWKFGEKGPAAFTVEKKTDHFLFVAATPAEATFGETIFPVMRRGKNPASWPHFYVRWQPAGAAAPTAPALTLDILPTATPGKFVVYLRGEPLPNAKILVHHGNGESELTADASGSFEYKAPAGLALLTCNHKEPLRGFYLGESYDVTSHNTALSWRQP